MKGLFKNALLDAATNCCGHNSPRGLKRVQVAHDGRSRTSWWTPEVKQAVGEKKALFKLWIAKKTPENRTRYEEARRAAARVVAEAKAKSWELFSERMDSDYRTATKVFWQTIKRLRKSSGGSVQVVKDNSWIMTERTRSRVQAAEMRFLQRIFGVTRTRVTRSYEGLALIR